VRLRVLGSLDVQDGAGNPIDPGGLRQQVVLAMLLLECPAVVSRDRLVDAVWPGDPPATARSQIQICVSNLRQRLGNDDGAARIVTRRPGYALDPGDAGIDRLVFERAVAEGRELVASSRTGDGAAVLREALALWRGPAVLPELSSPAVRDAAVHLEESRAVVLEEFGELMLAAGWHRELVALLSREILDYPLRERLRSQLMLALFGSGRQADALREYRRAREVSIAELGIEPAEPLRRLETAILRGDTSLIDAAPRPPARTAAPAMLPAGVGDFTGRQSLLHGMLAAVAGAGDPAAGPAPVLVISGPGGVGKSALALHLAHRVADRFPDGRFYASFGADPTAPDRALERFLRALGVPPGAIPESLEDRSTAFRERITGRSVLIVVDDAAAESLVRHLIPPDAGSALVVTSRRRLTALPGATRFEVGPFSPREAVALLERVLGERRIGADREAAEALARSCGYLPLAVRIAAARLAARPHWSIRTMCERLADDTAQLDELQHGDMAVRGSLLLTYESLAPESRRLLRLLALLETPRIGGWACEVLLGCDARAAGGRLDELVELHLLEVDVVVSAEPLAGQFRLHELVRLFARERAMAEDSPAERVAAITRFVQAFIWLVEQVYHREYDRDLLVRRGVPRVGLDERVAERLLAEPLVWLRRERAALVSAVAQAAALGLHAECWGLAVTSVVLFEAHGLYDEWRSTHLTALNAVRRAGDRLGEAAVRYSLGSLELFEQRYEQSRGDLQKASSLFAELGEDHGQALAERNLAILDRLTGNYTDSRTRSEAALRVLRAHGDRSGEAHVLVNLAQLAMDTGDVDEALSSIERAAAVAVELPNRRIAAQITHRRGLVHLHRGEGEAAEALFTEVLEFAQAVEDRSAALHGLVGLGEALLLRGEFRAARRSFEQAGTLSDLLREKRLRARALLRISGLDLRSGDVAGAEQSAAEALGTIEGLGLPILEAECRAALADIGAARASVEAARP
jgi:DNA-binding SARP family transcriptional activator/tetratricopeptide (TPR) repeat protein